MRKEGYYWVRIGQNWLVRFWNESKEYWNTNEDLRVSDSYWAEIDERQIIRNAT
jgi:hypothetical protein